MLQKLRFIFILISIIILTLTLNTSIVIAHESASVILNYKQTKKLFNKFIRDSSLQKRLDILSNSELINSNDAQLLISGIMSTPLKHQIIDRAQHSIILSTFAIVTGKFKNGNATDQNAHLLTQKLSNALARGVEVYIITDGIIAGLTNGQSVVEYLKDRGAKVIKYNSPSDKRTSSVIRVVWDILFQRYIKGTGVLRDRWHQKALIVDSEIAIVGGMNWGENYMFGDELTKHFYDPKYLYNSHLAKKYEFEVHESWPETKPNGWRDTDILLSGPIVKIINQKLLDKFYRFQIKDSNDVEVAYNKTENILDQKHSLELVSLQDSARNYPLIKKKNLKIRYIEQTPIPDYKSKKELHAKFIKLGYDNFLKICPQAYVTNFYLNIIEQSSKQILWGSHSLSPLNEISESLISAANRGVRVVLLTNGKSVSKQLPEGGKQFYTRSACWAREALSRTNGKLEIYHWLGKKLNGERHLKAGPYHGKTFQVDGYINSIGSYNPSPTSYCRYTENTAVVFDPDFGYEVQSMFEKDLESSKRITLDNLKDLDCTGIKNFSAWRVALGALWKFLLEELNFLR